MELQIVASLLTCIHWEHLVVSKEACDELLILSKYVGVEGSRCQCEYIRLPLEGVHNAGMAMALVDSAVGTQEVVVAVALHIPDEYTCSDTAEQSEASTHSGCSGRSVNVPILCALGSRDNRQVVSRLCGCVSDITIGPQAFTQLT